MTRSQRQECSRPIVRDGRKHRPLSRREMALSELQEEAFTLEDFADRREKEVMEERKLREGIKEQKLMQRQREEREVRDLAASFFQ